MKKLLLLLFFISLPVLSQDDPWKEGLHMYVGGGPNLSVYHTSGDSLGAGLHFKTDFGYSFKKVWAIEAGSFVKFVKIHDTLIWDTALTLGLKRKLPDDYYIRVFAGQAPTVFYTDDTPDVYRKTKSSRVIYTGPVIGFSLGKFHETWFWETSLSYQSLDKARGIRDDGSVPTEVFRTDLSSVKIFSASVTFGMMVF
ncbi:MAG: hypothetical protein V4598_09365 [Bdellovibrionota bacterium]